MTTTVEVIAGSLQTEPFNISELPGQGAEALRDNGSLSELPDAVFASLSRSQFQADPGEELRKDLQGGVKENPFLGDPPRHSEAMEHTNFAAEKITEIYERATTYTVACNMAKKTGRDVETLLKAQ